MAVYERGEMQSVLEGLADSRLGMFGLFAFLLAMAGLIITGVRQYWPEPSAVVVGVVLSVFWVWFAAKTVGAATEACRELGENNWGEYNRRFCRVVVKCDPLAGCEE